MSERISFIHAADLHLDSPFNGLAHIPETIFQRVKESTFNALDRLVQTAIDKKVDFVLIAGDLFDNEKQSLKGQVRLRQAFEQLERYHINVYLSYGNHDFINGNIHPVTYPDNVYIFPEEKVTHFTYEKHEEIKAAIYGFSYENRSVITGKAAEFQKVSGSIPYHVAMLHGSLQSNTEHDVYAPFKLSELTEKSFDYWALGHIHKREVLKNSPPIVYPGNIQGRNRKETGTKGCYHVQLTGSEAELKFVPLHSIQFNELVIDVTDCDEAHQLESLIRRRINEERNDTGPELLQLFLQSEANNLLTWENEQLLDDVIELVNETTMNQNDWKYIYRYQINRIFSAADTELANGEHFVGELIRHFDEVSLQPYLRELHQHKQARKYLDVVSNYIRDKARQLLVHELLKSGGD